MKTTAGFGSGTYTLITTTTGIIGSLDLADSIGTVGEFSKATLAIVGNNLVLIIPSTKGTGFYIQ